MHHLRKKGWSKKELDRLKRAKAKSIEKRSSFEKFLHAYLFWIVILAAVFTNFIIGLLFVPLLLVMGGLLMYSVIVSVGLCFGFLFENLVMNFDDFSHHHHVLLIAIVPAIAAISVLVFSQIANQLILFFDLPGILHNSLLVGLVYGLSFMLPFALKHTIKS
ncbi:MAG: hypothetical protein ABIF10_08045 [Candidatus Woesearchaeota archaeon]